MTLYKDLKTSAPIAQKKTEASGPDDLNQHQGNPPEVSPTKPKERSASRSPTATAQPLQAKPKLKGKAKDLHKKRQTGAGLTSISSIELAKAAISGGQIPLAVSLDQRMNIISTSVRFGTDVDQKLKNSDANSIASLLSQFTLTKETNGKRYEREFERQELATLHSSIASQLALSGELDGALKAFEVALSAKADFESSNASARSSKKRIAYVSSVEHQPRLTVRIPETCISIVKEVEVRFEELANVLESNDVGLEAKERSLDRCFLTYGAMVPLVYTLGGQLKMLGMTESSHNTQANEVKAADNAEGDLNAGKGPVSISIATKTSTDAISRTDRETKSEQSDYSHEANGGDATLVGDPNKWIKSLDDPAKLVVIEYDDLLPIWNFFSAPLKQRFEKQKALIQNIYETKIERYNAKTAALGAILHENKTLESRTKFPLPNNTDVTSINLAPKYKLGEKIHYGVQGVEGAISQQGKLEADFSIWNQLLPSDNATFFAHDGNIFTYISQRWLGKSAQLG